MSTRRPSSGSTRGTEPPAAKKTPAKRARGTRTEAPKQEDKQALRQEVSIAPAVVAHDPIPAPIVPRPQVAPPPPSPRIEISPDARRAMVAEVAYLRAERRGFAGGGEVEDWLAAEAEVEKLLQGSHGARAQ